MTTNSYVAYLASTAPEQALKLSPRTPAALESVADRQLLAVRNAYSTPAGTLTPPLRSVKTPPADATADAVSAILDATAIQAAAILERDPLSASAIRMLAEVAYYKGDTQSATKLIETAARRNLRETIAVYHWMNNSLQTGNHADALSAANILIKTRPEFTDVGYALMARLAEIESALPLLTRRLLEDPPWRSNFLASMTRHITDARTPLKVLIALKDSGKPPQGREFTDYLRFLVDHGFHEIAHYAWLQFLTPEQLAQAGYLYNGDFQHMPSGSPMDWLIKNGVGADIAILPHDKEGDDRGLRVELGPGRVQFGEVMQSLILPPGDYTLSGSSKGEVNGRRGLRWRLTCANPQSTLIAETPMLLGIQATWRTFEVTFSVPAKDCKSQMFRLVHDPRFATEQFVTGVLWYDKLKISRR